MLAEMADDRGPAFDTMLAKLERRRRRSRPVPPPCLAAPNDPHSPVNGTSTSQCSAVAAVLVLALALVLVLVLVLVLILSSPPLDLATRRNLNPQSSSTSPSLAVTRCGNQHQRHAPTFDGAATAVLAARPPAAVLRTTISARFSVSVSVCGRVRLPANRFTPPRCRPPRRPLECSLLLRIAL